MSAWVRLLTIVVCFELIIGPSSLSTLSITNAHAEDCAKGQTWSKDLNYCVTDEEVAKTNDRVSICTKYTKEEDKQKCYAENAQNSLTKAPERDSAYLSDQGKNTALTNVTSSAAVAIPLFMLIKMLAIKGRNPTLDGEKISCTTNSLKLMYAGGGVLALGEILTFIIHNSKLNAAREKLTKITTPTDGATGDKLTSEATEAQSEAFELLAQNEESIGDVAKTKLAFYAASAGTFAAASVMAVLEQIQLNKAKAYILTQYKVELKTNPTLAAYNYQEALKTIAKLTCTGNSQGLKNKNKNVNTELKKEFKEQNSGATRFSPDKIPEAFDPTKDPNRPPKDPDNSTNPVPNTIKPGADNINPRYIGPDDTVTTTAIKNINSAKNLEQLMQLYSEIEAMKYDNYSRLSYLDDKTSVLLRNQRLDPVVAKIISQSILIQDSNAQDAMTTATSVIGLLSTVVPMVSNALSQKKLDKAMEEESKIITMKDGKPVPPQEIKNIEGGVTSKFEKTITSPVGRLAMNGILMGWMTNMSLQMNKQVKLSQERVDYLRKVKEGFNYQAGIQNCTEADRQSTTKLYCYCYLSNNQKNPARANSTLCSNLWGTNKTINNNNYFASNTKVCVDVSYGVDPACTCKTRTTSSGQNSCLKVGAMSDIAGINSGTLKMLNVGSSAANDLLSGVLTAGQMDAAAIGSNAIKIKNAADSMLQQVDPAAAKQVEASAKGLEGALVASTNGLALASTPASSASPLTDMNPKQALKELVKELKKDIEVSGAGDKNFDSSFSNDSTATEEIPEFGLNQNQLAVEEAQVMEVMKNDLDYRENDINSGSKTNIFDVLSNRYQRSGMRRLFDEKNGSVDGANKNDISE